MEPISVLVQFVHGPRMCEWLAGRAPRNVSLHFASREEPLADQIAGHRVVYGPVSAEALARADALEWVQSHATGVESYLHPAFVTSPVTLTNIKGVLASPMAEHAMGMMLFMTRRLDTVHEQTRVGLWKTVWGYEIAGSTVAIIGLGHVGAEIARRLPAFGVRIVAVDPAPAVVPEGVERVVPPEEIDAVLAEARVVFVCAPATRSNHHLFDAGRFAAMPPGSWFLNLSRGALVDESALAAALETGHLAGAALDVTETEPYPPDGRLWKAPNILISSHSSAYSQKLDERKLGFFAENLARFAAGEPLVNVVDKKRGY